MQFKIRTQSLADNEYCMIAWTNSYTVNAASAAYAIYSEATNAPSDEDYEVIECSDMNGEPLYHAVKCGDVYKIYRYDYDGCGFYKLNIVVVI